MSSEIHSQTDYADQVFKGAHLRQAEIASSEFHGCTFIQCSFVESVLSRCRFVDCTFQQCDLSLVQVPDSVFSDTRFEDSKIIGVNWAQADWSAVKLGQPLGFYRSTISHCTFIGLSLRGMEVKECVAKDVDFREADLSKADFAGTDLSESLFIKTNLSEADLSGARNYQIAPGQNELRGAKFSLPEAMSLLYGLDIVLVEEGDVEP
ncbi:MAG: pentapeptide repeat-containing protein [Anaerolineae bacterium]|jgi:fluoroquinolone resistance protein